MGSVNRLRTRDLQTHLLIPYLTKMEIIKKKIKCIKCNSILEISFKNTDTVKHFKCPICQAKLKVNFAAKGKQGSSVPPLPPSPLPPSPLPPSPPPEPDSAATEFHPVKRFKYSLFLNGMKFPLDPGANTIGCRALSSNAKVQLPVGDMHMSRAHVVINVKVDRNGNTFATLSNFKNMNWTRVNGTPIGQGDVVKLHKGDQITMGQTTFIFDAE